MVRSAASVNYAWKFCWNETVAIPELVVTMSRMGTVVGRDEVTSEESVGSITMNPLYEQSYDEAQGVEHPSRRT